MTEELLRARRFPVGEFMASPQPTAEQREQWITTIVKFPQQLRERVTKLSSAQQAQTYRPAGWNVKQLVHHCADSHLNAYLRFKLALTEDRPIIKPYDEAAWAELVDGQHEDLTPSLAILEGVHQRWVNCMCTLAEADWQRMFFHPEHAQPFTLVLALENYDWHCRHHLAHVELCVTSAAHQ